MKLNEEESFYGEIIETPEVVVEDLCERVNIAYDTMMEEDEKMSQLAFITTFLIAFKGRLNRVCEKYRFYCIGRSKTKKIFSFVLRAT